MPTPAIHWFRNDLRLNDNSALNAAVRSGRPLISAFILDEGVAGEWAPGGASRWWLHHSLESLAKDLEKRGGRLILLRGDTVALLSRLIEKTGAEALYWSRCYEPYAANLEKKVSQAFKDIEIHRKGGSLLQEPEKLRTASDDPYKVFTPFWKALLKQPDPPQPVSLQKKIDFFDGQLESEVLDDWHLLPTKPDWAAGLRNNWTPGEAGADKAVQIFLDDALADYKDARDRPDKRGTSRLSPHLHFGEISPRQIWHAVMFDSNLKSTAIRGGEAFLRELGWRDFSNHLLHHWPDLPSKPFRENFVDFPWKQDKKALTAWQRGRTGYPIVDAGMRELWHTGWMHNRVRMIAASLLVKHLLIPWQDGERWFWDTLVDADLANNSAGWQWVAGCGADAAPYFRIFNPIIQGKKFDPDGTYVRKWVPELHKLPSKFIHEPWSMPDNECTEIEFTLGRDYPRPLVEHSEARQRALSAYDKIKKTD